jgi:hypothetical protein
MSLILLRANSRTGEFTGLNKTDVDRKVTAEAEALCDVSVRIMGPWL